MTSKVTLVIKDIDPRAFDDLRRRLEAGNHQVRIGFPAGVQHKGDGDSIAMAELAAVHEFGAPSVGIPERPFMRVSLQKNRPAYVALNRQNIKKILQKQMDIRTALGRLGELAKGDMQKEIAQGSFAPLKPSTIRRKGSSRPLVDSGQMRQSIAWEIDE